MEPDTVTRLNQVDTEDDEAHDYKVVEEQQDGDDYLLARDKTRRETRAPNRYGYADLIAFALVSAHEVLEDEPKSYKAALACKDSEKWKQAVREEMRPLHENNTWELIKRPSGSRVVRHKWFFKRKEGTQADLRPDLLLEASLRKKE